MWQGQEVPAGRMSQSLELPFRATEPGSRGDAFEAGSLQLSHTVW